MQIFGDFIEVFPPEQDSLELTFTPSSIPLKQRWRNNRLSAYFIADYFTTFLPLDDHLAEEKKRIKESKDVVSYVANELLENAMKYNDDQAHFQTKFGIHFLPKNGLIAVIFATNSISLENSRRLKTFIDQLFSSDPETLYFEQIENSATTDNECSGLGLLTMINDYNAKLGWKFETVKKDNYDHVLTVTTMVQIVI